MPKLGSERYPIPFNLLNREYENEYIDTSSQKLIYGKPDAYFKK
ncbi:hypothetical protein MASR2M36_02510 [Providencia sp.]